MGGNLGRQHPGGGSSRAVGLSNSGAPGTHSAERLNGVRRLEEAARPRGRGQGQGPGGSVCGMVGGTASPGLLRSVRPWRGLGRGLPRAGRADLFFTCAPPLVCSWTWEVLSVLPGGCLSGHR